MLDASAFLGRQSLISLTLGEEHVPGRKLRMKSEHHVLRRAALGQSPADDLDKAFVGKVVSEIEVGEVVLDEGQARGPRVRVFLFERINQPFPPLGLDGLLMGFGFKSLLGDDPGPEDFAAHALPNPNGEDGVLGEFKVERQGLWEPGRVENHFLNSRRLAIRPLSWRSAPQVPFSTELRASRWTGP